MCVCESKLICFPYIKKAQTGFTSYTPGPLGPVIVQGGHLAANFDGEHGKVQMTGTMAQRSRECGSANSNKHTN